MSAIPVALAKENDADVTTPLQNRRAKVPASAGRSFGTPLSNCTSVQTSVTTSKKFQLQQSSSKKMVRARKLVQQYKVANSSTTALEPTTPPTTTTTTADATSATTYTVTFSSGSIGLQLEPAVGQVGAKVTSFVDGGYEHPGQARPSNQIQMGDEILEINDMAVSNLDYNDIVDLLKELAQQPLRKILFHSSCVTTAPTPMMEPSTNSNTTTTTIVNEQTTTPMMKTMATNTTTTPSRPDVRSFSLNSQGAMTPVVSTPHHEDENRIESKNDDNNNHKAVSSVLFINPTSMTPHASPNVRNATGVVPAGAATVSPMSPSSPAYNLLPQDSVTTEGDVKDLVLEINDESIDSSSTISPSKVKNLSQEDLELGLGGTNGIFRNSANNNNNNNTNKAVHKPLANVLRTVFNRVGVTQVGSFDLSSRFSGQWHAAAEGCVENKLQVVQDLNNAVTLVGGQSIINDMFTQSEEKKEETVAIATPLPAVTSDNGKTTDQFHSLEQKLQEANDLVEELSAKLASKQTELDCRLREAQEEANARVQQISKMQLATQTELEQKLLQANAKVQDLLQQQQQGDIANLKFDLELASKKVDEITAARDEALVSLEATTKELDDKTQQKTSHFEVQLQVAKLQRELRDSKKEKDKLKSDIAAEKAHMQDMQKRLDDAEKAMHEQQGELEGTKCMMETYEEKFIEREREMEVILEEKDFGYRELDCARSEIQSLTESLAKKKQELSDANARADDESRRLHENLNMAQKELDEKQQLSYDRERELQAQLTGTSTDLAEAKEELEKMRRSLSESTDRERSLEAALKQRDADYIALNQEIDTNVASLKDKLEKKDKILEDTLAVLSRVEAEKNKLEKEVEQQHNLAKHNAEEQRELQAVLAERDGEVARKEDELVALRDTLTFVQESHSKLAKESQELRHTATEMYQEKSRINKDLQETKIQLSEAKADAQKIQESLLQRAKEFDSKAKESQSALKQKENELAMALAKLDRATAKTETVVAEVESKERSLRAAMESIKFLEDERDQHARRESQLKAEIVDRETEKQGLQETVRETKSQLFSATNRVSFLERQINSLEASRSISDKEAMALKEEIQGLNARIESQRAALDSSSSEISAKSSEIVTLRTTVENLREELQQRTEEVVALQTTLETSQGQYTDLHERFVQVAEESSEKIQALTAQLIQAQDNIAEKSNTQSKLDRQIISLKQQLQDSEDLVSDLRAQIEVGKEKVVEMGNLNESIKKDSEDKTSELSLEVAKHVELAKQLEEECVARTADNARLKEDIASLEKKLASTRSLFGTEQNKHKNKLAQLESLINSQKEEISALSEKLTSANSQLGQLEKHFKSTQAEHENQLTLVRNTLSTKEARISELVAEKEANITALSTCREELSIAHLEIQRLEDSRTRSREEVDHLSALLDSQRAQHMAQIDDMMKRHGEETTKFMKEKEELDITIRKGEEFREEMQSKIEETQTLLEKERENTEYLEFELDAYRANLHRAEDKISDLEYQLSLKEEQANESSDSIDNETLALSKSELRIKCKYLTEEIQEAEMRAAAGSSTVSQKQHHIRRLEEDVSEMSEELGRMIETSAQLESALINARMEKANCEEKVEELQKGIDEHQARTTALKDELNQQYNENSELLDRVRELQMLQQESKERENALEKDLEESRQALKLSDIDNIKAKEEVARLSKELLDVQEKRAAVEERLTDLEFQITKLEDDLRTAEKDREILQADAQRSSDQYEVQLRDLRTESAGLRSTIADLEENIGTQQNAIRSLEDIKQDLQGKLEKQRKYGLKMENLREEAVSKLAEASRVLAAQKGIITVQEARAAEAEENVRKLSDEVETLQEAMRKVESAKEENGRFRSSQIEELEKKRALLEKARLNAKAEADSLRDEVRQANRKASELDRINKSLQTRIDELKHTADTTKAQLKEARGAWGESDNLARKLENDLQRSRSEIDHLRAKLQLCGATIARLKSDRVLFEEAAMKAHISKNSSDPDGMAHELSQLKSELHTKASQLSSCSSSLRNYKKVVLEFKTTEKELVLFIEDIIARADASFTSLSEVLSEMKAVSVQFNGSSTVAQQELNSLDLAVSPATPPKVFDDASCCVYINNFVSIIQEAAVELESKRRKLDTWKANSTIHASTPPNKTTGTTALLTPSAHSVQCTFRKMKEVIDNKMTSTEKAEVIDSTIKSLESQIDALCSELKAANAALCAKDKLFADLEQERITMQRQIASLSSQSQHTQHNDPRKLSCIQEVSEDDKEKMQVAAARLMCKVIESRTKAEAASALRKWSNVTAAQNAASKQQHTAEALSKQLEMTRGKLVQLKAQFIKGNKTETPHQHN